MGGIHMLWMLVPILLIVLVGGWILFLILSRPLQSAIDKFHAKFEQPASGDGLSSETLQSGIREDMLIVIPDISGYTKFITSSRFALSHAHFVISELLAAIVEAGTPTLRPMRLEGDAVVFHADAASLDPSIVGDAVQDIFRAYYRRLAKFRNENICRCEVCDHLVNLELKVIVHHGEVIKYRMGNLEDVTGRAMIVVHRLLKNRIGRKRYVLVTETASNLIELPASWPSETVQESIDGLDAISFKVFTFERENLDFTHPAEQSANLLAKAKDVHSKLIATVKSA